MVAITANDKRDQNELIKLLSRMDVTQIRVAFEKVSQVRDDLRLSTKLEVIAQYNVKPEGTKTYWAIVVDAETTGLDIHNDEMIEAGLVAIEFDQEGIIYDVKPVYNGFEQPTVVISEEITGHTGITNEMVKGHHFDDVIITQSFEQADLIIAHNAGFDRPFFERRFPAAANSHWGCSLRDIDWDEEGIETKKLGALLGHYGTFFEAHRAEIDVRACIHLLSQSLVSTGETALVSLIDTIRMPSYHVFALKSSFESKDLLKARGYHWNPGNDKHEKCWHKEIPEADLTEEVAFLRAEIYPDIRADVFKVELVGSLNRYSSRGGDVVTLDSESQKPPINSAEHDIERSEEFNQTQRSHASKPKTGLKKLVKKR